jgi:predicted phosphoribosyltransferase
MRCEKRLEVVNGATHLFEEPGTLNSAALLAQEWFSAHLARAGGERRQPAHQREPGARARTVTFRNRREAGAVLGELVRQLPARDSVVLGLPRGGVPVAFEVARAIEAPLDVFVVRKLGVPGHEELAMGAIASGDVRVLNDDIVESLRIDVGAVEAAVLRESSELRRREALYRDGRPPVDVRGKRAILVDDGLATGASMLAAVTALRKLGPAEIVVAVPVAAAEACRDFSREVDTCICAATPEPFYGVGRWYTNFASTSDEEVRELLAMTPEEVHP